MYNLLKESGFRNKSYESVIERLEKRTKVGKSLDSVDDIHFDCTPEYKRHHNDFHIFFNLIYI